MVLKWGYLYNIITGRQEGINRIDDENSNLNTQSPQYQYPNLSKSHSSFTPLAYSIDKHDIFPPTDEDLSPTPSNFLPVHDSTSDHHQHHQHLQPNTTSTITINKSTSTSSSSFHIPVFSTNADSFAAYQCHFLGGSFSLALAYALVHPLDTIKTTMQANATNTSTFSALRSAILSTTILRSLLHGFTVSIIGAAPQGGLRFSTYEYTKCKLLKYQANKALETGDNRAFLHPFFTTAMAAAVGDLFSSVVKVPREVITQRLQIGQYNSAAIAAQSILKTEGWRGLYAGYISTACRDIPFMIVMFSVYENIKEMSNGLLHEYWWCSALAGAASGAAAGFATTPFDVIKTRIMTSTATQLRGNNSIIIRPGMYQVTQQLINNHGWKALMTGFIPRSIWWFSVCGVFFPAYEQSKVILYRLYNHRQHQHQHHHQSKSLTTATTNRAALV